MTSQSISFSRHSSIFVSSQNIAFIFENIFLAVIIALPDQAISGFLNSLISSFAGEFSINNSKAHITTSSIEGRLSSVNLAICSK
jgi:hypothetical protein